MDLIASMMMSKPTPLRWALVPICLCQLGLCPFVFGSGAGASASAADYVRIGRPAFTLDLGNGLLVGDSNREPIAEAPRTPGIYRAFLVWRQKYAHLAICRTDLCHGSCIEYGDGCLVSASSPILPAMIAGISSSSSACASGCSPVDIKQQGKAAAAACCH